MIVKEDHHDGHGDFAQHLQQLHTNASGTNGHPGLLELLSGAEGNGHQSYHDEQHGQVPTVALGRTRCYWAILSPTLDFVFVDPILHTHLGQESKLFIGTNLLQFVHPDEREALGKDLIPKVGDAGGIENSGVFGSITRCRYSRLPRIRKLLGCPEPPVDPESNLFAEDDEYLQLRITTSWIGGGTSGSPGHGGNLNGAVLAFFHATEDKDGARDNDELKRSTWSNWCGPRLEDGSYLDAYRCAQLVDALRHATHFIAATDSPGGAPPHVFQILDHNGHAIVSFPDAGYDEEEYASLARDVLKRPSPGVEDTTSCTRRYRSKHPVMKGNALITVESVVIKYGAVTFACFETGGIYFSSAAHPQSIDKFKLEDVPSHSFERLDDGADGHKRDSGGFEDDNLAAKRARRLSVKEEGDAQESHRLSIGTNPRHYASKLSDNDRNGGGISPTVASASAILGSFSNQDAFQQQQQHPPQPFHPMHHQQHNAYMNLYPMHQSSSFGYPPHPLASQNHQPPPHPLSQQHSFAPAPSFAPPPHPHAHLDHHSVSPNPPDEQPLHHQYPGMLSHNSAQPPPVEQRQVDQEQPVAPPSQKPTRVKGEPKSKQGPKACDSCGTETSPEWRKGPDGTKSLCNACGLRFARAVARKNKIAEMEANGGVAPPKKPKKAKAPKGAAAAAATAPAAASTSKSNTRPAESSSSQSHRERPSPPQPAHSSFELPPNHAAASGPPPPHGYSPYFSTAPPHQGHYAPIHSPNSVGYPLQVNTGVHHYEGQRSAGSQHESPFGSPHPGEDGKSSGFAPPPTSQASWAPAPTSQAPSGYQTYAGWSRAPY